MSDQPFGNGGAIGRGMQYRPGEAEWVMPPDPQPPVTCRGPEPWVDPWTEQRADGREGPGLLERIGNLHIDVGVAVLAWLTILSWVALVVLVANLTR